MPSAGTRSWWRSPARAGESARRAPAAAWPRRPRSSPTGPRPSPPSRRSCSTRSANCSSSGRLHPATKAASSRGPRPSGRLLPAPLRLRAQPPRPSPRLRRRRRLRGHSLGPGPHGRPDRIRDTLPRHKRGQWVGPGRRRKASAPDAQGVIHLSPLEFLERFSVAGRRRGGFPGEGRRHRRWSSSWRPRYEVGQWCSSNACPQVLATATRPISSPGTVNGVGDVPPP
jgi:hypothetical protein